MLHVYPFCPVDDGGKHSGSQLTLDDLFQRKFQVHDPNAKWISGKSVRNSAISVENCKNDSCHVILVCIIQFIRFSSI